MAWSRTLHSIFRLFSVMGCGHPAEDEMRRRAKYYRLDMGGETHKGSKKKGSILRTLISSWAFARASSLRTEVMTASLRALGSTSSRGEKKNSMLLIPRNVGAAISDEEVALGVEGTFIYLWEVSRMTTIRLELSCRRRQRWTT
jgi:hypothetical protein